MVGMAGGPKGDAMDASVQTVLLVDDDAFVRESVAWLLEDLGYQVRAAADGHEAIRAIEADPAIDVVILDHTMPGLSGMATLDRLRALRPRLPVVYATGRLDPETTQRLARFPKVRAVAKPFTPEELQEALTAVRSDAVGS